MRNPTLVAVDAGSMVSLGVPDGVPDTKLPASVVQLVAPVEFQVSVTLPPGATVPGLALSVAVGATGPDPERQHCPLAHVPLPDVFGDGHDPEPV